MGAASGHILSFLPLADALKAKGHEPVFVLKDISRTELLFEGRDYDVIQAPVWLPKPVGLPPTTSYTDLLMRAGYLEYECLTSLIRAWKTLYALLKPDMLVFDFAPTAQLAAREMKIPKTMFGTGFASPPEEDVLPSLHFWKNHSTQEFAVKDNKVLLSVNKALNRLDMPVLDKLSTIFEMDLNYLRSFKELDHYPNRKIGNHIGPAFNLDVGVAPKWPMGEGKKIFAYLHSTYHDIEKVLQILKNIQLPTIIYSPHLPEIYIKKYQSATLLFHKSPCL